MIKIAMEIQLDVGDEDRFFGDLRGISDRLKGEGRPVFWKVVSRLDSAHLGLDQGDTRQQIWESLMESREHGLAPGPQYSPLRIAGQR